jgi:hypothetical protein|tara:strand:- start:770 stop:1333 length:564 start_codon:yes stop_codon:yes gene_type:complete
MSAFEFVTVLFSVIVGLAISHLLSAASELIEIHSRVKIYWVNSVWVVTIFIWDIFSWWGMWELNNLEMWNYPSFFLVVVNLSGIYLMTTLVLPQPTETGRIDLEKHYFSVHRIFFIVTAYNFASIILINHFLFFKAIFSPFTIMPFLLTFLSLYGAVTKSRRYHAFVSVFTFISLIIFMSLDVAIIK